MQVSMKTISGLVALIASSALAVSATCGPPPKRTYTIPQVTKEIEGDIHKSRRLKNSGKLRQASLTLLDVSRRILKEYPQTTLTQEPVKKLVLTLEWIANLCLDRSLELKNESVSPEEDSLSKKFRVWSDEHRENASKLRDLIPNLQKAAVAARQPPPMRPSPAMSPSGGESKQPKPDEPRLPSGSGSEPGSMEP